jgi:hypothetical protein
MTQWIRLAAWFLLALLPAPTGAQQGPPPGGTGLPAASTTSMPPTYQGPPAPRPPETITRDPAGRATVRAERLATPLRLDGRLDEAVYEEVAPMAGFIQTDPLQGVPATQDTDVWVFFDDDTVYVAARCWESEPARMVANVMQRDSPNIMQNENFSFIFDPFYDRRNAVMFIVNPIGGWTDGQIIDRQYSRDWNTIWEFGTDRFEGGWTLEVAIPFKSLRYQPGRSQLWGFNARRINRWKNEVSHLTPVPNSMVGTGLFEPALAATMVGMEAPSGAKNLEIKPYLISNLASDMAATPRVSNDLSWNRGFDIKYGITQNVTADFTYNTDFAQVEADEQQVNLSRFSLFFPEKREFFLENLGLFGFGGISPVNSPGNAPILFYSRRIGLDEGRVVPIEVGGRMTGRVGRYGLGLVNIQTHEESLDRRTNFAVARVKRDILRKSSVGVMVSSRSVTERGGANAAYGVDGTFAFFDNLAINGYWAGTSTEGASGDDRSYRGELDYTGDRYGVRLERLAVGSRFNPEIGFARRTDIRLNAGTFRFSPRPRASRLVRRYSWTGSYSHIENGAGRLEARDWSAEFAIDFHSSDRVFVGYGGSYEFVPRPFRIATNVTLPVGGYDYASGRVGFNFGRQRAVFGNVQADFGDFYNGTKTGLSFRSARATISPQLFVEPSYSVNWVDLVEGSFTTHLVGSRVTYTVTPRMFASALLQYASDTRAVSTNMRLRWEYQPGSELFVVFNEQRDGRTAGFPDLANRAFVVKVNRLLRF